MSVVNFRIRELLADALEQPTRSRARYLDEACAGEPAVRAEVEALLDALFKAGDFLNAPLADRLTPDTADGAQGSALTSEAVGSTIGRYKLLQLIGQGGFGSVFMAEQLEPVRRLVALKIIKLGMDTGNVIARFEAERQALAMMDHPNIAKVLDAGATDAGRPYFVMELVRGVPITQYCDASRLSMRERLALFVQVCNAVRHAHQKGIIHRDLKPSNVLVTLNDGAPVPKVIDFGIAKATGEPLTDRTLLTEVRQFVGTPQYMSPEQAGMSGLDVDTRSDIYSLGVLLYELLTGTTPFDALTLRSAAYGEMQRIIRETDPPKPSTRINTLTGEALAVLAQRCGADPRRLGRSMRGELDWIVMKALEKDRTRRYGTADALAQDVTRHLADEPVEARPPGAVYRVVKFTRRHKVGVSAGAFMALALLAGIAGTSIGLVREHAAKSDAQTAEQNATHDRDVATSALADVKVARSAAERASRKAIAVNVDLADAMLKNGVNEDARKLALATYETARLTLGGGDPITRDAADALGRARLAVGDARGAREVLDDLVNGIRSISPAPARCAQYLANAAEASEGTADHARAQAQFNEAIARWDKSDPAGSGRIAARLGDLLRADGNLPAAAEAYSRALRDLGRSPGDRDPATREVIDRQAAVLVRLGRYAAAAPLLAEQLSLTRWEQPGDSPAAGGRAFAVADALLQAGQRDEAVQYFNEAVSIRRRLGGEFDPAARTYWRVWSLREGLGDAPRPWASAALRGQAWFTTGDVLAVEPSQTLLPDEIKWDQARFRLARWDGKSATTISQGPLSALRDRVDPPPGLYLLSLEAPRAGSDRPLRSAGWIQFAPWKLAFHDLPPDMRHTAKTAAAWPDLQEDAWRALANAAPVEQRSVSSLVLADNMGYPERFPSLHLTSGPRGRDQNFGLVATSEFELPPGTYRFATTSDDGMRLWVDGRNIVDAWHSRPPATDYVVFDLSPGKHQIRVEYYQATEGFALHVVPEPVGPGADELMARALGEDSRLMRSWLVHEAEVWEAAGRLPEAIDSYRKAIVVAEAAGAVSDQRLPIMRSLGRSLIRAGRDAEAVPVLEKCRALTDASLPGDSVEGAMTRLDLGALRVAGGERQEGRALLSEGAAMYRRAKGVSDMGGREIIRRAVLHGLGSAVHAPDGSLAAQAFCALDEMLLNAADGVTDPRDVTAESVHYLLRKWGANGSAPAAQGALADIGAAPAPGPGLYLLSLDIHRQKAPGLHQAQWLLVSDWNVSLYQPPRYSGYDQAGWRALTEHDPAASEHVPALAFLTALRRSPAPDRRDEFFAVKARTTLQVPPGRYRLSITADDGARAYVDGRRVINDWVRQPARLEFADLKLDGAPHSLVVEYCQRDGAYKLWVRLDPLSADTAALATSMGMTRPRTAAAAMAEQTEAVDIQPWNYAALAARAALHARLGQFEQADADYVAALRYEGSEPLWPQQRAALALLAGDEAAYHKRRRELLDRSATSGDDGAARTALVSLLRSPSAIEEKAIEGLLPRIDASGPDAGFWFLARGALDYRAGRLDAATHSLRQAVADAPTQAAGASAELLLAMALHASGHPKQAHAALEHGSAIIKAYPNADSAELDAHEVHDWLVCQIIAREAEGTLAESQP